MRGSVAKALRREVADRFRRDSLDFGGLMVRTFPRRKPGLRQGEPAQIVEHVGFRRAYRRAKRAYMEAR